VRVHVGVDVGGTNARVALVDDQGHILRAQRANLGDHTPAGVVATVHKLLGQVMEGSPLPGVVGVGFAAMVRGPVVVNAPNFGWRDVDFGTLLERALGRSVRLANDLSAAAWGELKAGAARGLSDTLTVFVGTGVGSAVITQGKLLAGATGVAGEFGHTKMMPEGGRPCGCGETGCLEAYMGGARLTAWMREVGLPGTPTDLERLAMAGDGTAHQLYETAVGSLSLAIANQVTMLNPAMVVLGGGVLGHAPGMVARVREVIQRRAGAASRESLQVELAALGDNSGLVGAALLT
jgi:glucokinase